MHQKQRYYMFLFQEVFFCFNTRNSATKRVVFAVILVVNNVPWSL